MLRNLFTGGGPPDDPAGNATIGGGPPDDPSYWWVGRPNAQATKKKEKLENDHEDGAATAPNGKINNQPNKEKTLE